ncbi:hypothetical protein PPERSA_08295 [Pseudocohnilembus persalinus]|uniref:MORN motif n=1 Tax=Pseudocohnilembus persalinus TaxID=266149 RepID=A0A0V0QQ26_PSEPJ|nr:hypothetical protein PPERSA_08295 [Pseudocohnilembus persalinus]|eukprot:KRX04080.1 hypothetical protein PPERSA_08295 [Pseudocohnilembus persalinus]
MKGLGKYTFQNGNYIEGEFDNYNIIGTEYNSSNNAIYKGKFYNFQRDGEGRYIFKDGGYVEGQFKNNKVNGYAKYVDKNGDTYEGQWVNNNLYDKEGKITFDGGYYKGSIVNSQIQAGTFKSKNGIVYNADFIDNQINGHAQIHFDKNTYLKGQFV